MTTTWDPGQVSGVTLSGGNLVATSNSFNFNGVRATPSQTTGKRYFEVTMNASFSDSRSSIGICSSGATLGSGATGGGTAQLNEPGTQVQAGGFDVINCTLGAFTSKTVGVAVDLDNKQIWWTLDGSTWNAGGTANPTTDVGFCFWDSSHGPQNGPFYIMGTLIDSGCSMTLNTGNSGFVHSLPTNFIAWDGAPPLPSKSSMMVIC